MKRILALLTICAVLMGCLPSAAMADQMEKGVPVWTEETVRQYAMDFMEGKSMERLWGYYDLQIRRYMPEEAFATQLLELEFMTGDFLGLGSYRSFEEPENQLKVHVLHLCMEKQDLDMYFTHKDKEDDWEIMAVEFVPADEEEPLAEYSVPETVYTESELTVGAEPYLLDAVLTLPATASQSSPAPVCVMVHDYGPLDRDHTIGGTKMFEDFAHEAAKYGVATLRYDKRTYAYPDAEIETVRDEVVEDALYAIEALQDNASIDTGSVIVVGVGFGGMLAPRIADEAQGRVGGLILIGATPNRIIDELYQLNKDDVAALPDEEEKVIKNAVRNIGKMKEEAAREIEAFGHNGYYYWEAEQYATAVKLLRSLKLPLYVAHGNRDTQVDVDDGFADLKKNVGPNAVFATYKTYRGLNHMLMNDLSTDLNGKSTYEAEAHMDTQAVRELALWILDIQSEED